MHPIGLFLEAFCQGLLKFLLRKDKILHCNNLWFPGPILSAIKPSWTGLLVQSWIFPSFPLSKLRKLIILCNATYIFIWFLSGGFCLLYVQFCSAPRKFILVGYFPTSDLKNPRHLWVKASFLCLLLSFLIEEGYPWFTQYCSYPYSTHKARAHVGTAGA